jgi:hypothetical protein
MKESGLKRSKTAVVILSVAAATLAASGPVLGECSSNSANTWPAFEQVAPRAETVIVGRVVRSAAHDRDPLDNPHTTVFTVKVEDVLRGKAPATIEFNGLRSGVPLRGERTCRQSSVLYAKLGDRIAVAFGGRIPGVKGPVTTAAWIEGLPNNAIADPGLGTMDLNDVRRLMGRRPVPSFRAVLSGSAMSIEDGSIIVDDVPAVSWTSDEPMFSDLGWTTTGSWDVRSFAKGWEAHASEIDPPFMFVRVADVPWPHDAWFEVGDIVAEGGALRLDFTDSLGFFPDGGHFGPTSLFLDIGADPTTW